MTLIPFWLRKKIVLSTLRADVQTCRDALQTIKEQVAKLESYQRDNDDSTQRSLSYMFFVFEMKRDQFRKKQFELSRDIKAWSGFANVDQVKSYQRQTVTNDTIAKMDKFIQKSKKFTHELEAYLASKEAARTLNIPEPRTQEDLDMLERYLNKSSQK